MQRILVIRGGAIGDFILTFPALAALRHHFPAARIDVLGYPPIASLALLGGWVNEVRSIESPTLAAFFAKTGDLDPVWKSYFASFDLIISYAYDPQHVFEQNIKSCGRADFVVGPYRPDETKEQHATDVFLQPFEHLGIRGVDPVPRLCIRSGVGSKPPRVALHPGSGSEKKNWPEHRWASLINQILAATDWTCFLVGGEAEENRLSRLRNCVPPGRLEVAQNVPLTELSGELSRCSAFVGHDSGISHLAAAVGLRGVVLWGNTNETVWRPRSEAFNVIRGGGGLAEVEVPVVFAALTRIVAASGSGN